MEIRVLTSSSVHSRGLDDFIASQMICGKCNNGLQFGRTGGQSCEPLEEKIGGEVTTARQMESKRYQGDSFTRSMAGCFRFLTLTQSDPQ